MGDALLRMVLPPQLRGRLDRIGVIVTGWTLSYRIRSRQPGFHHSTNSASDWSDFAGRPRRRTCFPYRCRRLDRSWAWGTPGMLPGILGGQHLPHPLLSLLAGCNGVIALLLGLLPAIPLGGQFLPHALESLFDNLLLAVHALNRLIPGEPLMGQFGLEVVDRRLGLLEQMLCMLSCRDLLPQSLPCRFERIGAGCVTLIPVDDRDRNLAIPDEAPTLWM